MEARKLIFEIVHDIKRAAELSAEVYQYVRKRRDCPGAKSFKKMEKILNNILDKGTRYIKKEYDE